MTAPASTTMPPAGPSALPPTVLPARDEPSTVSMDRSRLRPAATRRSDVLAFVGAGTCSVGTTWLLFNELAPFSGRLGELVVGWLVFVAAYALLVSFDENGQAVVDRVAMTAVASLAGLLLVGLAFVLVYVIFRGRDALVHLNTYYQDMSVTGPLDGLDSGGIFHGIVGTIEQITIALVITIPLGLTCAVFLNEFRGPFPRFVRTIVEAMTALPSIVAGLFVFSTYILTLGMDKSGFAAALALGIMMLPIIIRAADVVIRLVPGNLREASLAMGAGRWRTVWHVVLPTSKSGLATAVILGTARGIGETSPVLLTAGYGQSTNFNPFSGPQVSLPLLAFELFKFPNPEMRARSFGAAAVLLLLVLGLFVTARIIGGRGPGNLSPRQRRKVLTASAADAQRIVARHRDAASPQTSAMATVLGPLMQPRPDDVVVLSPHPDAGPAPDVGPISGHDPGPDLVIRLDQHADEESLR